MRFMQTTFVVVLLAPFAIALAPAKEASAGGGYFPGPQPASSTQVSGHRMILSVSKDRTTLWDQLSYVGSPESFAWVLPVKGAVEVGVSSDALFNTLEALTAVVVHSPPRSCPAPPSCAAGSGVVARPMPQPPASPPEQSFVIAQEAVGPYEMAQLSSLDASALQTWMTEHGYVIPAEVGPIISAYAAEGFNFLAIKLAPGKGIDAMKPVRVTSVTTGESPALPLRMAAAGAGTTVPITLWTFGDTYLPSNLPWFTVPRDKLVWDWDKNDSNYASLRQEGFAATSNTGWLVQAAGTSLDTTLRAPLCGYLAKLAPELSGYADEMGNGAQDGCDDDLDALYRYEGARPMTRLYAELPREALSADLTFAPSKEPLSVDRSFQVKEVVGTPPGCPLYEPCSPTSGGDSGGCGCAAVGSADASAASFGALLSLGWVMARRRKKAARTISP